MLYDKATFKSDTSQSKTEPSATAINDVKEMAKDTATNVDSGTNPFYQDSSLYMQFPAFDKIFNSDYAPAFKKGMAENLVEINAIANNPEPATFENTMLAMEKSGQILSRVSSVFFALSSANTNDDIKALRSDIAPKLSAHSDEILLNPKLFNRVKTIYEQLPTLKLDAESQRLVKERYKDFIGAGAQLSDQDKETLKALNRELATLTTQFSQNVLEEVNSKAIVVDDVSELAGLSDTQIASAAQAAKARNLEGKYVLPLLNTSQQPSMSSLENRKLRERILNVSQGRGSSGGDYDNRELVSKVFKLRAERAQLLGYANHAAYQLVSQTAKTTDAVNQRLSTLAPAAVANANKEAADLQARLRLSSLGLGFLYRKIKS